RRDRSGVQPRQYSTTWFIEMPAISEPATIHALPHLREKMARLLRFDIDDTQYAYARLVHQPPATCNQYPFGKGGSMVSLIRPIGYRRCLHFCRRMDCINESGLPHTGIAQYQRSAPTQQGLNRLDVHSLKS